MKAIHFVCLAVSLLLGGSAYLACESPFVALGVLGMGITSCLLFIIPCLKRFGLKSTKRHECYLFIHSYLITLSVTSSLGRSFEAATDSLGPMFHELDDTLSRMNDKEKVEYLANYFETDIYRMFLSILDLYLNRGGDVLRLSAELTAESARIEETEQQYERMAAKRMGSFIMLWLMALVIVVFIRFGLPTYFGSLKDSMTYQGALLIFYAFMSLSFCLYCYFHTGVFPYRFKRRVRHVDETEEAS